MATQVPKNGDFSQLLGPGENLLGFVAQTPNGTLVNGHGGDGYSHPYVEADGGWNIKSRRAGSPIWFMKSAPWKSPLFVVVYL